MLKERQREGNRYCEESEPLQRPQAVLDTHNNEKGASCRLVEPAEQPLSQ
jgi:hypothetical protein